MSLAVGDVTYSQPTVRNVTVATAGNAPLAVGEVTYSQAAVQNITMAASGDAPLALTEVAYSQPTINNVTLAAAGAAPLTVTEVTYGQPTVRNITIANQVAAGITIEEVQSFDNDIAGANAAIEDLITVNTTADTATFDIDIPAGLGNNAAIVLVVTNAPPFATGTAVVSSGTLGADNWNVEATNLAQDKSLSLLHIDLGNSPTAGTRTCTLTFSTDILDSDNSGFQDVTIMAVAYILTGANQTGLDQTAFQNITFFSAGFGGTGAGVTPTNNDSLVIIGCSASTEAEIDPTATGVTWTERNTASRPPSYHCADFIQGTAAAVAVTWTPDTGGSADANTFALSIAPA